MADILKHRVNSGAQFCGSDVCSPEESNFMSQLEEGECKNEIFPGPLMSDAMQKEDLDQFIKSKAQECFQKSDQKEAYLFWEIMDLFCRLNGKVMMSQIAIVFFKGYRLLRKKTSELRGSDKIKSLKNLKKLGEWCLPLAQLLCSFAPDVEHKESIIKMGEDLASKGLMWAAHLCYVVARVELGTRSQFELVGGNSTGLPFGIRVMNDAIERTEVYEYVLWLTSGLAQANFQVYKLCHASRLALFEYPDNAFQYCEIIARAIITSPDRFKRTFFDRVIWMAYDMLVTLDIEEKPGWLLELSQLSEVSVAHENADADPEQPPTSSAPDVEEVQDSECQDKISVLKSPDQEPQTDPDDALAKRYTVEELLGEGGFGSVHAGIRIEDGRKVAIKYVNCSLEPIKIPGETCELPTEVALMKLVCKPPKCSNVVELLEWFGTPDRMILVMERPSPCMDLCDFLESHNCSLSEAMTRDIMAQVVRAVQHCRDRGVVHRDIKAENLLINTDTMEVKIIDFGCGALLRNKPFQEIAGTAVYCPPEWLMFKAYEGIPATVWGLGILLYLLVCGEYPFESVEDTDYGHLNFSPDLSKDYIHLVIWCLDFNPDFRPSLEGLIGHEWFTEAV